MTPLAHRDARSLFERAWSHGMRTGLINAQRREELLVEGTRAIRKIADILGTEHLRGDLERPARSSRTACFFTRAARRGQSNGCWRPWTSGIRMHWIPKSKGATKPSSSPSGPDVRSPTCRSANAVPARSSLFGKPRGRWFVA